MNACQKIRFIMWQAAEAAPPAKTNFFKTGEGGYAEHDKFIGVNVPTLRKITKEFKHLSLLEIEAFLISSINEERLLALLILVNQYKIGSFEEREKIYQYYLCNLKHVNNWNLVDTSAHLIIGAHLFEANSNKAVLVCLATSSVIWYRRIAIVSTWYFIKNNQFEWTIKLAEMLLYDHHDLIHKAVGWMLREMGKRDISVLITFLDQHAKCMPRTMLRYAIEKLSEHERKGYLLKRV